MQTILHAAQGIEHSTQFVPTRRGHRCCQIALGNAPHGLLNFFERVQDGAQSQQRRYPQRQQAKHATGNASRQHALALALRTLVGLLRCLLGDGNQDLQRFDGALMHQSPIFYQHRGEHEPQKSLCQKKNPG